jgi:hypothetical protein
VPVIRSNRTALANSGSIDGSKQVHRFKKYRSCAICRYARALRSRTQVLEHGLFAQAFYNAGTPSSNPALNGSNSSPVRESQCLIA